MLRIVSTAFQGIVTRPNVANLTNALIRKQSPLIQNVQQRYFGALSSILNRWNNVGNIEQKTVLSQTHKGNVIIPMTLPVITPARTVIKFSLKNGKRKTVKAVTKRFYRLNWGIWIRPHAGRTSKMWTKSLNRKSRLKRHVFVNATQSTLLDKMVTMYWKRPRYYVDDPYNPYHQREEFPYTRKKPLP
ncbi:PREDICTED: 39S ribosomal protein L35, mitochondrial [Dufourea novaeangliae]|uniref:Large ribosomal subunit protein bL35m n=1 Tax=Dufourea novaeangliae TaxID=178035 RepID=A0A154PQZ0_DUFNO|nr:PREDICTED: 39S ribosomal protein L35, mitochondrial [Dufourea novaeangliae]KZC14312.1 39S ribosomal protein L35, mitochondrial [Dufourea novaeangliae]